ncbi:MAG TPA: serine/threonine-protein kinase [Polyangiaceae bacterium]|nr:serine/threonine-protein kinase [Polyangiaceae bacterium]
MTVDRFGLVGTVIASAYHVESVVAEGGFGVVYRARHGGFRAPVALKCLKVPQGVSPEHQARFLEQFRAEAELMFRLSASTPTVTRPLHVDVMTTPSGAFVPFMVLEWLEGETLDALVRSRTDAGRRPFTLPELVELLEPVARALARAHHFQGPSGAESIVHCDLKPENVFVATVNGERAVKILDFGVAKVRGAAAKSSGEMALFTPAYAAPEQWNPKALGDTGPWTDVWGLALTLVEAMVGHPVITGDHLAARQQILDPKRRPTPRQHGVAVSDRVESVLARALAVDPGTRYQDAGAFWKALAEAAQGLDLPSAPSGPLIPDLVPLERKPSHPEIAAVQAPASFDFDELEDNGGSGLALDLPPDEPRPRRSFSPSSLSAVLVPTSLADAPTVVADAPPSPPPPPGPSPSLAPLSPRAAPKLPDSPPPDAGERTSAPPVVRTSTPLPESEPPLLRRLAPGLALAASSIVLTLLDRMYAAFAGEVFTLGPVRTSWLAAALLVGGIGLAARELLSRS